MPDQLVFSGNTIPAGHIVRASARNLISAEQTVVEAGAIVQLKCGNRIRLGDGFRCGGALRVSIGNVDGPSDETSPQTSASVKSGHFTSAFTVVLAANEPARVYYTLDGSIPTLLSPSKLSPAPISITGNCNLRFFAVDNAGNREEVQSENYIFNSLPSRKPGFKIDTPEFGSIAGSHAVTQNGSFSYSIPIQIPPGRAGLQPDISIRYDSNSPEGTLGVGWQLQGMSCITRGPRNRAYDNGNRTVSYDNGDVFMLNGQRLVPISGSNGENGSEYRPENDPSTRVRAYGAVGTNGGPTHFKLWTKSGLVFTFGGTSESRVMLGYLDAQGEWAGVDLVNYWAVDRVEDPSGNFYAVDYTAAYGTALPVRITYTRHKSQSGGPDPTRECQVQFAYKARAAQDITLQYVGLAKYQVLSAFLLDKIVAYAPNSATPAFEYRLAYENSPETGRQRLVRLEKYDGPLAVPTPPTHFKWSNPNLSVNEPGRQKATMGLLVKNFDKKYILQGDLRGKGTTQTLVLNNDNTANPAELFPLTTYEMIPGSAFPHVWGNISDTAYPNVNPRIRRGFIMADCNNDGKTDLVYIREQTDTPSPNVATLDAFVYHAGDGTFAAPVQILSGVVVADIFNNTTIFQPDYRLLDLHGDGRTRLLRIGHGIRIINGSEFQREYHFDQFNLDGTGRFGSEWVYTDENPFLETSVKWDNWTVTDLNRDGWPDMVAFKVVYGNYDDIAVFINQGGVFKAKSFIFDVTNPNIPLGQKWHIGDFDGDGFSEIMLAKDDANAKLYFTLLRFQDDNGQFDFIPQLFPALNYNYGNPRQNYFTADANSDGKMDLVRTFAEEGRLSAEVFRMRGFAEFSGDKLIDRGIDFEKDNTQVLPGDTNGDGVSDYRLLYSETQGTSIRVYANDFPSDGKPVDVIELITDGMGLSANIHYGIYHDESAPTPLAHPEIPFRGPTRIVAALTIDNLTPLGHKTSYDYGQARANALGMGFKGFGWQRIHDELTGITTINTFRQDHPFIGQLQESRMSLDDDKNPATPDLLISKVTNTWNSTKIFGPDDNLGQQVLLPVITHSESETYEIDEQERTSTLVTKNMTTTTHDHYGNALSSNVIITGYSMELYAGTGQRSHITDNNSTYDNITDGEQWFIGRLRKSSVGKRYLTDPPSLPVVRTVGFDYNATSGLLEREVIEPGGAESERLTTTHSYDMYGNETLQRITGHPGNIINRAKGTVYDANGVFPVQRLDYLKFGTPQATTFTSTFSYDKCYGHVISATDINGLTVQHFYDGLGRKVLTENPDGTWTRLVLTTSLGDDAPANAFYKTTASAAGAPDSISFCDKLGRTIRTISINFNGDKITTDAKYDEQGRIIESTLPAKAGTTPSCTVYTSYDKLGRVVETRQMGGNNIAGHARLRYLPLKTIEQEERNGTWINTIKYTDMFGNLLRTVNMDGFAVEYELDAHGNVTKVFESNDSGQPVQISTMTYDRLGRQLTMAHKDMGWNDGRFYSYKYYASGELFEQTDPKGNITSLYYDDIGRLIYKVSAEDNYAWTYDTAKNGKGSLAKAEITGSDKHRQTYQYDGLGRSFQSSTTINGETFVSSTGFDELGRVKFNLYPSGFSTSNIYNSLGFLQKIVNSADGLSYWEAQEYNDRGQLTKFKLGNGLVTEQAYDQNNGLITSIKTGTAGSVQDLAFTWDKAANLLSRENRRINQTEMFEYDNIQRLVHSTVNGLPRLTYSYARNGNLLAKPGIGGYGGVINYSYGASPHAVVSVNGSKNATYAYDFNGNMTSGDDRILQYTKHDMVKSIQKGPVSVKFDYGVGGESRIQQTESAPGQLKVTKYLGHYEKVTTGATVEEKHYIAGVAIYTKRNDSTQKTRYLHMDHLGSTECISNESGDIVETFAFDAFGQRRNPNNWSELVLSFSPETIKEGFTGHEMLDSVGLVHMNARTYDPVIGRFLSADGIVDGVGHTQGQNRYAYVHNNPLSMTDPTGNFGIKKFLQYSLTIPTLGLSLNDKLADRTSRIITENRQYIKLAAVVAINVLTAGSATPLWVTMMGGFASGMIMSGGDIQQGLLGALTAGAPAIVNMGASYFTRIAAGALIGGTVNNLQGKDFKDGLLTGGLREIAGIKMPNTATQYLLNAVVDGVQAELKHKDFMDAAQRSMIGDAFKFLSGQAGEDTTWYVNILMQAALGGLRNASLGGDVREGALGGAVGALGHAPVKNFLPNALLDAGVKGAQAAIKGKDFDDAARLSLYGSAGKYFAKKNLGLKQAMEKKIQGVFQRQLWSRDDNWSAPSKELTRFIFTGPPDKVAKGLKVSSSHLPRNIQAFMMGS